MMMMLATVGLPPLGDFGQRAVLFGWSSGLLGFLSWLEIRLGFLMVEYNGVLWLVVRELLSPPGYR